MTVQLPLGLEGLTSSTMPYGGRRHRDKFAIVARYGRRVITKTELANDPTPHVQWRVSSLPARKSHAIEEGGAACKTEANEGENDTCGDIGSVQEVDGIAAHPACSDHSVGSGQDSRPHNDHVWTAHSSEEFSPSTALEHILVGGATSSCDGTDMSPRSVVDISSLIVACRIFDDNIEMGSSCESVATARARTEAEGDTMRHMKSLPVGSRDKVLVEPQKAVCDVLKKNIHSKTTQRKNTAHPHTDGAPPVRREWTATPHLICRRDKRRVPVRPREGSRRNSGKHNHREILERQVRRVWDGGGAPTHHNAPCLANGMLDVRSALKVPAPPPRPAHTPCPIWAVLRNRTLMVAREDPSIFSEGAQGELKSRATIVKQKNVNCWHVLNRRIFGLRETPHRGKLPLPEWIVFAGGVPPQGIDEQQRWMLRLGQFCKDFMS